MKKLNKSKEMGNLEMNEDRDEMFEEMSIMSYASKIGLLSRLYGLMETHEKQGKEVDPKLFFELVRQQIKIDNQSIK